MYRKYLLLISLFLTFLLFFTPSSTTAEGPTGAKALFHSGDGATMKTGGPRTATKTGSQGSANAPTKETYSGISYQLILIDEDGDMKVVSKSNTFSSGERIKILAQTNRAGYLTVLNVGSSGKTHVLFNSSVSAFTFIEIPQGTNLVFVGDAGEEKIIMMLSDNPNPFGTPGGSVTAQYPSSSGYESPSTATGDSQATTQDQSSSGDYLASAQDQPMTGIWYANNVEGAKDIVLEDRLGTKYAVVSPRNKWKPLPAGKKDIIMESSGGVNYGVIPASSLSEGGILTLVIKVKHK